MSLPSDEMTCEIEASIPELSSNAMSTSTCEVGAPALLSGTLVVARDLVHAARLIGEPITSDAAHT